MESNEFERKMIVVVGDPRIHDAMVQRFPAMQFEVHQAQDHIEALGLASIRNLRMLVTPADEQGVALAEALEELGRTGVVVMGTIGQGVSWLQGDLRLELFSEVVDASDLDDVVDTARRLLGERRKHPRVGIEFPLGLGDKGEGVVREVSATSLRVNTMMPLSEGDRIEVRIGWGGQPLNFEALVGRSWTTARGQRSLVLMVGEESQEARSYLDKLVHKIIEVQHFLSGFQAGPAPSQRGPRTHGSFVRHLTQELDETIAIIDHISEEPAEEHKEERTPEALPLEQMLQLDPLEFASCITDDKQAEDEAQDAPLDRSSVALEPAAGAGQPAVPRMLFVALALLALALLLGAMFSPGDPPRQVLQVVSAPAIPSPAAQAQPPPPAPLPLLNTARSSEPEPEATAPKPAAAEPAAAPAPAPVAAPQEPAPPATPAQQKQRWLALVKQGRKLVREKKFQQATQVLDQARQLHDGLAVQKALARAHEGRGDRGRAIVHYSKAAQLQPDVAWFQVKLAMLQLGQRQPGPACKALDSAVRINKSYLLASTLRRIHCKR